MIDYRQYIIRTDEEVRLFIDSLGPLRHKKLTDVFNWLESCPKMRQFPILYGIRSEEEKIELIGCICVLMLGREVVGHFHNNMWFTIMPRDAAQADEWMRAEGWHFPGDGKKKVKKL